MKNKKIIFAISYSGSTGKSSTLRAAAQYLLQLYPNHIAIVPTPAAIPATGDFRLIVNINNKIIAIESQGDPNTNLGGRLKELAVKYKADVILCTARTRGATVDDINKIAHNHGYEKIWTTTYFIPGNYPTERTIANDQKGQQMIALLQALGVI